MTTTDESAVSAAAHSSSPTTSTAIEATLPPALQNSAAIEKVNTNETPADHGAKDAAGEADAEKGKPAEDPAASAAAAAAGEDESQYPSFWKLVLLTTGLLFALFLVSLVGLSHS
jgi:hypothetical protein